MPRLGLGLGIQKGTSLPLPILNQIPGSVFAISPDKLNNKAISPMTLSFSDASPNFVVPFKNGTFDMGAVDAYVGRNRVVNPTFQIDTSPNDTHPDSWAAGSDGNTVKTYIVDDGGAQLVLNSGASVNSGYYTQNITVIAGETVKFSVDVKSMDANSKCTLQIIFQDGVSTTVGTSTIVSAYYADYTKISLNNIVVPPTAIRAIIRPRVGPIVAGQECGAWFKNVSFSKTKAYAIDDSMTVDSNVDGVTDGWTFAKNATGTSNVTTDGQLLIMTNSAAQYRYLQVSKIVNCTKDEVLTLMLDYKLLITTKAPRCTYSLSYINISDGIVSTVNGNISTTQVASYTNFSVTFTVPSDATITKCQIYLKIDSGSVDAGDAGEVSFRNVKVYRSNVSAYVQQATDQSGNGNHAIQNTQANQPRVMNNGIWNLDAIGKVAMYFDGVNDVLENSSVSISNLCTMCAVSKNISTDANGRRIVMFGDPTYTVNQMRINYVGSSLSVDAGIRFPENAACTYSQNISDSLLISYTRYSDVLQKMWLNGSYKFQNAGTTTTFIGTKISVGGIPTVQLLNGYLSELIILTQLTDAQRQKLEKNQGKRFAITVT